MSKKSLHICPLILDLSSSSSDLQLMCEGWSDKNLWRPFHLLWPIKAVHRSITDKVELLRLIQVWFKSENDFQLNVDETGDRDGNQGDGDYERQEGKVRFHWPVSFSDMQWLVSLCKNLCGAKHVMRTTPKAKRTRFTDCRFMYKGSTPTNKN